MELFFRAHISHGYGRRGNETLVCLKICFESDKIVQFVYDIKVLLLDIMVFNCVTCNNSR